MPQREVRDQACVIEGQGTPTDEERVGRLLGDRGEGVLEGVDITDLQGVHLHAHRQGRGHDIAEAGCEFVGVTRTARRASLGTASLSSASRFSHNSVPMAVTPVTFPSGRARLATSPDSTGSTPTLP